MPKKPNQNFAGIPGPPGVPLVGNLIQLLPNPLPFIQKLHQRYGNVFYIYLALNRKNLVVLGPEATQTVLVTQASCFSNELGYADLSRLLGSESLLFKDGTEHAKLRSAIAPAFTHKVLGSHVAKIDTLAIQDIPQWIKDPINLLERINLLTMQIAARTIIGMQADARIRTINGHIAQLLSAMANPFPAIPGTQKWHGMRSLEWMKDFFRREIAIRKGQPNIDVFSALCQAHTELADEQIVDNMIGILAAAYETTASATSTLLYALAHNPIWQQRLRDELKGITTNNNMNLESARSCKQTGWAIKEALRLYAPLSSFPRRTTQPVDIEGYNIPANTQVTLMPQFVHHMPSIYPLPEQFDPSRFSAEKSEDAAHKLAWMPFGKGAHTCIGMHFAQLEITVILARILERYQIDPSINPTGKAAKLNYVPIVQFKQGLPIKLRSIQ